MDSVRSDDISTSDSDLYKSSRDLYRSPELLLLAAGRRSFETRVENLEFLLCLQRHHCNT